MHCEKLTDDFFDLFVCIYIITIYIHIIFHEWASERENQNRWNQTVLKFAGWII
jgi:hypothetical protein